MTALYCVPNFFFSFHYLFLIIFKVKVFSCLWLAFCKKISFIQIFSIKFSALLALDLNKILDEKWIKYFWANWSVHIFTYMIVWHLSLKFGRRYKSGQKEKAHHILSKFYNRLNNDLDQFDCGPRVTQNKTRYDKIDTK